MSFNHKVYLDDLLSSVGVERFFDPLLQRDGIVLDLLLPNQPVVEAGANDQVFALTEADDRQKHHKQHWSVLHFARMIQRMTKSDPDYVCRATSALAFAPMT